LDRESAYIAEFSAVEIAIEIAFARGWSKVWFEMDSYLTLLNFFNKEYIPPWKLRRRWEKSLQFLSSMEVRASHIYREGNVPADILSNVALTYDYFTWWSYAIPEIQSAVDDNMLGRPIYRFC